MAGEVVCVGQHGQPGHAEEGGREQVDHDDRRFGAQQDDHGLVQSWGGEQIHVAAHGDHRGRVEPVHGDGHGRGEDVDCGLHPVRCHCHGAQPAAAGMVSRPG
jgi:hypothetical protein